MSVSTNKKILLLILLVVVLIIQFGMTLPGTLDAVGVQRAFSYVIGLPFLLLATVLLHRNGKEDVVISVIVFIAQALMAVFTLYKLDFYNEIHWGAPLKPESMKGLYRPKTTFMAVVSSLTTAILFAWSVLKRNDFKNWRFLSSTKAKSVWFFSFLSVSAFVYAYVNTNRFGELRRQAMPPHSIQTEYTVVQKKQERKKKETSRSGNDEPKTKNTNYSEFDYEKELEEQAKKIRDKQHALETERALKEEKDGDRADWYNSKAMELQEMSTLDKSYDFVQADGSIESEFSEFLVPIWNHNLSKGEAEIGFSEPRRGELDLIRMAIEESTNRSVFPDLYIYLLNEFAPLPFIDSLKMTDNMDMIDDYYQRFDNGIVFKYDYLPAQGDSYYCLFPTDDIVSVRAIMKYLLKDFNSNTDYKDFPHRWITPNYFGIDGVGCHYHIARTDMGILVTNYCGC